jgi:hypothetical protein
MFVAFALVNKVWMMNQKHRFVKAVRRVVGDEELTHIHHPNFLQACFLMEILMSCWFFISWAIRTYTRRVDPFQNWIDQFMCACFMILYLVNAARDNFAPAFAMKPGAIFTVATVVPTFSRKADSSLWFSFSYLRASNAVTAVIKIEKMGALSDVSDVTRMYIQLSLRTFALIANLVGTTFVLEILGDPESMQDRFIQTNMGGLSFVQLTYWIVTTISTVGYGDYAPKTVLSRLFIIMAIAFGVCFFSEEINEVVRVYAMENSGRGRYNKRKGTDHVVLIGGGVRQFSSVMQSLMFELYSQDEERWPDLVIMASAEQPELLRKTVKSFPKCIRQRVRYYMGDPTEPQDMGRVRMQDADLIIIIPSLLAAEMNSEDEANILRGLAVKSLYPQANLRLMLLRSTNKKVAVQVGFPPSRCFSINEQKSGLFALACSCRGFSTMITQFIMADPGEERPQSKTEKVDDWILEYREGRKFHMCGFMINSNYAGINFANFATLCSKRSITPLAVQISGKVQLAPEYTMEAGDVVFALVRSTDEVKEFVDPTSNWREVFKQRQSQVQFSQKISVLKRKGSAVLGVAGLHTEEGEPHFSHARSSAHLNPDIVAGDFLNTKALQQIRATGIARPLSPKQGEDIKEEGKTAADKISILEEKAKRIAEAGGHHILVLLQGAPWQQVQVFLSTLRADHLPFHIPILVLIPKPLPSPEQLVSIFEKFPRTSFVKSNGTPSVGDLRVCGMKKARCIALLAGNAGQANSSDRRMVDGAGVTLLACIEGELMESDSANVPVFLELHQQESIRFLSRYFERDAKHAGCEDAFDAKESFTFHPRFANGNIFTASCFGATVAKSFNMPGIVELMEAITLGKSNAQNAFPWQVSLPEGFDGRPYGELTAAFLESHNAVCLGMFRLCFPNDSLLDGPRFVVTNPVNTTQLRESDYFFILGTANFGAYCFGKGILVGTDGAPSSTEFEDEDMRLNEPAGDLDFGHQDSNRIVSFDSRQAAGFTGDPLMWFGDVHATDGEGEKTLPHARVSVRGKREHHLTHFSDSLFETDLVGDNFETAASCAGEPEYVNPLSMVPPFSARRVSSGTFRPQ